MGPERVRIERTAPAKINLFLEVLGRRPSGYHDLRSVLMPVSLCDTLVIEPSADGDIAVDLCPDSSVDLDPLRNGTNGENLVVRAARGLRDLTGYPGGARVTLTKHIPIGGGLGGGSSDAAVTLRGLNELWGTGVPLDELAALGAGIGCDVPALVHAKAALIEGLGERVTRLVDAPAGGGDNGEMPPLWLVLVNPRFSVSTADVYARCRAPLTSGGPSATNLICSLRGGDVAGVASNLFNGLQATVFDKYPLIEMLARTLSEAGAAGVLLSGSGASVFGVAHDERHARELVERVGTAFGAAVWCRAVRTLPDGVMVAHGPLEA